MKITLDEIKINGIEITKEKPTFLVVDEDYVYDDIDVIDYIICVKLKSLHYWHQEQDKRTGYSGTPEQLKNWLGLKNMDFHSFIKKLNSLEKKCYISISDLYDGRYVYDYVDKSSLDWYIRNDDETDI